MLPKTTAMLRKCQVLEQVRHHLCKQIIVINCTTGYTKTKYDYLRKPFCNIRVKLSNVAQRVLLWRSRAAKQVPHCGAKSVNVGARVGLLGAILLWRSVALSSESDCVLLGFVFVFPSHAKVDEFNVAIGAKHYVARLHVAVHNRRVL